MKYVPLIWSALWRRPAGGILSWLTVTAAFALLGLMVGVSVTLQSYIDSAPDDVLSIYKRFPLVRLPFGMRDQITRIDGVTGVAVLYGLEGHHAELRNPVFISAVDEGAIRAVPQFELRPDQWERLFAKPDGLYISRKAATKWNLQAGDTFVVTTSAERRADGSGAWPFQVIEVVPDVADSTGFLIGNFRYIDEARPPQDRGLDVMFQAMLADAGRAPEVSREIDRLFANSGTPTLSISQRAASQNMANSSGHRTLAVLSIGAAGLFMILLLIASGIAQSVRERTPEFAVLKALGFGNTNIAMLVLGEVAIPCLAGAVLGTVVAMQLARVPGRFLPSELATLPAPTISMSVMLLAVGFGALLAGASALMPLLRVSRMSVVAQLAGDR